ncbi:MAG: zinc ribbon domain-containing protein [Actinobacteria bacterium]|nr:zinc ribbon domain-containing protein [Actinomycetota bacterium]
MTVHFCTHCGSGLPPDALFCGTCGQPVNRSGSPASSAAPKAAPDAALAGTATVTDTQMPYPAAGQLPHDARPLTVGGIPGLGDAGYAQAAASGPGQPFPRGEAPTVARQRRRGSRVVIAILALVAILAVAAVAGVVLLPRRSSSAEAAAKAYNDASVPYARRDYKTYCKDSYAFGSGFVYKTLDECVSSADDVSEIPEAEYRKWAAGRVSADALHPLSGDTFYFWQSEMLWPQGIPQDFAVYGDILTVIRNVKGLGWRIVGWRLDTNTRGIVPGDIPLHVSRTGVENETPTTEASAEASSAPSVEPTPEISPPGDGFGDPITTGQLKSTSQDADAATMTVTVHRAVPAASLSAEDLSACQTNRDLGTWERAIVVPVEIAIEVTSDVPVEHGATLFDRTYGGDGGTGFWAITTDAGPQCKRSKLLLGFHDPTAHTELSARAYLILPNAITPKDPAGTATVRTVALDALQVFNDVDYEDVWSGAGVSDGGGDCDPLLVYSRKRYTVYCNAPG